ncbi:MAG: polysaccharide pyruvyl transferase [Leptolyngbyaceae cyanobacterium SL_7_1]|nr:polysaccharide pyruvyl transferase [Leptolyngbyaceae cyanobacterium SL_7_1]
MKILITNTVALNGGDAAILLAIIDLLRSEFGENTEFILYDNQPQIAQRYYPTLQFRQQLYLQIATLLALKSLGQSWLGRGLRQIVQLGWQQTVWFHRYRFYLAAWCGRHRLPAISRLLLNPVEWQDLEHYNSADLIVSTGGTYLVEKYSLAARIFDFHISLLLGKPLVFYTQSLGPFANPGNRTKLRQIFDRALLILLRDEASLRHIQALGIRGNNTQVSSDVVFALRTQPTPLGDRPAVLSTGRPRIAISVRYWHLFNHISPELGLHNYRAAIAALTQFLVKDHQAEVTFLSTCQGIPEYWTDDSQFATSIFELLPAEVQAHVSVNREFHTPQTLVEWLSACDMIVATRMHMCILGLVAGTPVLPIAYEFKTKELFNRLGMGQWVHDIETIDDESLVSSAKKFLQALPDIQQILPKEVAKERERATESGALVKQAFDQWQAKNS